ncbi:glycosyltransferase [bacterium M00.F.Ca.ET.230.01.1.1]|nr:glycosyltransferase [bacterium M00.F.Ca.ET.230.01.1.1]
MSVGSKTGAPSAPKRSSSHKTRRVCVVSEVEFGSTVTADPGSATYALAQHLAKIGETVTLLWVPSPVGSQPDEQEIARLAKWCFDNFLVRLELLPPSPELLRGLESSDKNSVAVYHFLKQNTFDVVYFALEGGLAHFPAVAKRTGVFPDPPILVVLAHEPLMWDLEANAKAIERKEQMTVAHMERTSAETCDHLVVTGQSLLDWMIKAGWKLSTSHQIATPLEPEEWRSNFTVDHYRPRQRPAAELVHFSGTETRSGLTLFCDALDRLADSGVTDLAVTIVGAFGHVLGEHSGGMVVRRARQWPFKLKLLPIRDEPEIFRYLRQSHALIAITHSAAQLPLDVVTCLDEEIPFIATDVGSIRELLQPKSADAVMMQASPSAIAAKIASVLESQSFGPARPLQDREAREKSWTRLHVKLCRQPAKAAGRGRARLPLVSIITAHYNRARLLPQAIASVRRQDYPNIELIVVDDGSTDPDAIRLLAEVEPEFEQRGWRIIRQKNGFLGKARNTGIRAAKGSLILFLDDDNALFPNAVSTFVAGMQKSGADICTTFAKWLNEPFVPPDTKSGYMLYFPVGGPPDIALITNPYGDANAMFRREVFDKVGYLNEERGFSASDWEFFLRADLAGLEIVTVPEPLYWYRSSPTGMNRNAEWLRNRRPIINVFRKHKFAHTDMFVQLGISSNTANHEKDLNLWNLELRAKDERYLRLSAASANSADAMQLLAEIAAREGRADTAISLLAHAGRSDFTLGVVEMLHAAAEETVPELHSSLYREEYLPVEALRRAHIGSHPHIDADLLSYVEQSPDQLFVQATGSTVSMALLKGVCPAGTIGSSCWVYLDEALTGPAQFQIAIVDAENQTFDQLARLLEDDGGNGWADVSRPHEPREIATNVNSPTTGRRDLLLAVRCGGNWSGATVLGGFSSIQIRHVVLNGAKHPRLNAPQQRQRTRQLTGDELKRSTLATNHPTELPALLVSDGGIFLRPSTHGPVVAALNSAFPAFARSVVATVEIAHEEASPFEFAMALGRPEEKLVWKHDAPVGALAFSGWTRVSRPFELHDLKLSMREVDRKWLTIYLAIRLPRGSKPMPSNAFWRKLLLAWD